MRWRAFIPLLTAVLVPLFSTTLAWSQPADKPRRVGVLLSTSPVSDPAIKRLWNSLVDGLREQGWEEGRNVVLEGRFAGPDPTRYTILAAELVTLKVDAIVAGTSHVRLQCYFHRPDQPVSMPARDPQLTSGRLPSCDAAMT